MSAPMSKLQTYEELLQRVSMSLEPLIVRFELPDRRSELSKVAENRGL